MEDSTIPSGCSTRSARSGARRDDPADFADCESLVVTRQLVGCSTGIIDTRALSQTRSGSATQVSRGEEFPLSLRTQSSPAAGIEDVGGSSAAVGDSTVGTSQGCTDRAGNDRAVMLQTFAHSRNEGQFRSGVNCDAALTMSPPLRRREAR